MNHGRSKRKFGRPTKQRQALMQTLAVALIEREKIKTTEAKAKDLRPYIEKLITKGRKQSLATIRALYSVLPIKSAKKLMSDISPRFKDRSGGYTRIRHMTRRTSDGAKMAIIELVQ